METQPGDVILYPANGKSALSSRLVVAGEILAGMGGGLEEYSHAAILDVNGYQFEATFPKTGRFKIDTSRTYEVWGIGEPTTDQRHKILDWCRAHVGDWYNLIGVLTANRIRIPGTYYCSQFAGFAYAAASLKIGDAIMSPDSLADAQYTPGARLLLRVEPKGAA